MAGPQQAAPVAAVSPLVAAALGGAALLFLALAVGLYMYMRAP